MEMTAVTATCGICGIRRQARRLDDYLCGTCGPMLRIQPGPNDGLPPGRWIPKAGGILIWKPDPHIPSHSTFNTHKQSGERPCFDCYEAERQYQNARKRPPRRKAELVPCGTHAAYMRHKRRGEEPCDECVIGQRQYNSERMRQTRAKQLREAA